MTFAGASLVIGVFAALILLVALCYGGGFRSVPAFTGDTFGAECAGAV